MKKGRGDSMKIAMVGTGYVGLVSGVCFAEIGHDVTCIDVDANKVAKMSRGLSPIYEPGLEDLMKTNLQAGRLSFTVNHREGFSGADVIYIAVGTPSNADGTADLSYVEQAAKDIAQYVENDVVVVIKSTVPVGTNDRVRDLIRTHLQRDVRVSMASNPEFLREGSAVKDTFQGDRIVIGVDHAHSEQILRELHKPLGIPVYATDIRSAEMIKYASNAFLATKLSFINEIANICEKVGANVEDVALGMGKDKRIGGLFLNAGIGYGGSCFPKDTKALVQIAGNVEHDFELLKSVINVNNKQQRALIDKAKSRLGTLQGKKVAVLGLAFKPNTDDMREAASIVITNELIAEGAHVVAFDPIAMEKARAVLHADVLYADSPEDALREADCAMIVTEWDEVKSLDLREVKEWMNAPILLDGRNCFALDAVRAAGIDYFSIGRPDVVVSLALAEKLASGREG